MSGRKYAGTTSRGVSSCMRSVGRLRTGCLPQVVERGREVTARPPVKIQAGQADVGLLPVQIAGSRRARRVLVNRAGVPGDRDELLHQRPGGDPGAAPDVE